MRVRVIVTRIDSAFASEKNPSALQLWWILGHGMSPLEPMKYLAAQPNSHKSKSQYVHRSEPSPCVSLNLSPHMTCSAPPLISFEAWTSTPTGVTVKSRRGENVLPIVHWFERTSHFTTRGLSLRGLAVFVLTGMGGLERAGFG